MFWGEYSHQLDDKGRLIIPARFRRHLKHGAMLTRGLDQNLVIYPSETWQRLAVQVKDMPVTDPASRAARRLLFSGAVELVIDRSGRALIPPYLREHASLNGEVLIAGMETYLELWDPSQWRTTLQNAPGTLGHTLNSIP